MHSFQIDPMRVTQDAIPGMSIPLQFTPTKPGKYQITCAQLCGSGHSTMNGYFTIDTEEDYAKWLAAKSSSTSATAAFDIFTRPPVPCNTAAHVG